MNRAMSVSGEGFRAYDVIVGPGLLADLGRSLAPLVRGRTVVITDETVAGLYGAAALASLEAARIEARIIAVPAGEASKSFAELERVLDGMAEAGLGRRDLVVALGGGVVGDLAGLAAALYMRGVEFVQVPTTLLAQVDSSVGGKTAIDTRRGKNLVGVFHQPRLVLADIDLLATLPARQLRSGWAEVLKHGLICDAGFFTWATREGAVGASGDAAALTRAVERSVEIKSAIVCEDEKEAGRRALLNLGHTFGHALEAQSGFDAERLTHGEAVAVGCVLAARYSARTGLMPQSLADEVERGVATAGLPTRLFQIGAFDPDALVAWMQGDKKAEGGGDLTLVLMREIGRAEVVTEVKPDEIRRFLEEEAA